MSLRILIVEDEPVIALHLEDIVADAGHTVVGIATSMAKAVEFAAKHGPINLAIMDIDLVHKPDGIETARRLRVEFDVGSLFVSAHLTKENIAKVADTFPIGLIAKPFVEEQILAAIEPFAGDLVAPSHAALDEAQVAQSQGRDVGARADGHAGQCPWQQDGRRDLRRAWLLGFVEGRAISGS